jgi:hypothetical protein
MKNLEPVFRYDRLQQKNAPGGFDENRYTVGLNYWLGSSAVLKAAYQFDERTRGEPEQNAILIQAAFGF